MTGRRDYDYAPLTQRARSRALLSALSTNNRMVIASTVGVLLIVVPLTVFVALVATGNATDIGGLMLLAMCLAAGIYTMIDIARKVSRAGALDSFARVNGLEALGGSTMVHYAGSLFADGSHSVDRGVRTREDAFVEVGDRFPTTAPRDRRSPNRPMLYFRVRLAGRAPSGPASTDLVTPELHDALDRFAGAYTIEVSDDELTLFGSRGLDVGAHGRVEEAFALADALAARANAVLLPSQRSAAVAPAGLTSSGILIPVARRAEPAQGRPPGPRTVVGWTLALLIGGPILIAVVMSILDDSLRGNELGGRIAVALVLAASTAAVGLLVRAALSPRRTAEQDEPD